MKRSKSISLTPLSPQSLLSARPLYLGISSLLLAACGEQDYSAIVAESVDDCVNSTSLDIQQCEIAYQQALSEAQRTGPQFFNEQDCEWEFGMDNCYQDNDSSFFFPMMSGYLIADKLFDHKKKRYKGYYTPLFGYKKPGSSFSNKYMFADGSVLGRMNKNRFRVSESAFKPKPTFSRTVKRGGFGKVAAQKVKINQRKTTRSRSWGG